MTFAQMLDQAIEHAFDAHTHRAKDPKQALRVLDGKTPFAIHPVSCALTILGETDLPEDVRHDLALALAFHDLLEDTHDSLPDWLPERPARWVREMTFKGGTREEQLVIWDREPVIRLGKFVDKSDTLKDANWMTPHGLKFWCQYVLELADDAEANYGTLNVVVMARALARYRLEHGFKTRSARPR